MFIGLVCVYGFDVDAIINEEYSLLFNDAYSNIKIETEQLIKIGNNIVTRTNFHVTFTLTSVIPS